MNGQQVDAEWDCLFMLAEATSLAQADRTLLNLEFDANVEPQKRAARAPFLQLARKLLVIERDKRIEILMQSFLKYKELRDRSR